MRKQMSVLCDSHWIRARPSYRSMLESMWGALAISMSACCLTLHLAEQIWSTCIAHGPNSPMCFTMFHYVSLFWSQGMPTSRSWSWECDLDVLLRYLWQLGTLVIRWDWQIWQIVGRSIPEINWGKACQWSLRDHPLCHQCWGAASKHLKLNL